MSQHISGQVVLVRIASPKHAGQAQTVVIPRLQALLKELGVAEHGTVELAPVVDDDDQWSE
ncbi:MAG: hypothetical protein H6Q89_4599 [Myxococcaceae bacterium]|nr:hypothetical protein [Myxococcaceae bacterium]